MNKKHGNPTLARENKSFSFSVKAVDDAQGLIEAYGSVFNNVDQGDDVVKPGAFKRTIQNSKARVQSGKAKFLAAMLWQHDTNQPIGGWYDLSEDSHGLLGKGQIILTTQLGRECYELIKAGVIDQFSIGYDVPSGGASYDKSSGVRNLTELRLWEISPVTFAMNQEALLVGVKQSYQGKKMKKDFNDHYREQCISDWLNSDFYDLTTALRQSLLDLFTVGDSPQEDLQNTILNGPQGFIAALAAWVQEGVDLDVSNYLNEMMQGDQITPDYGWMSSNRRTSRKDGRMFSANNQQTIQDHCKSLREMAKGIHSAADDLATMLQGSEGAHGTDLGDARDRQEGKLSSAPLRHEARGTQSSKDTADDDMSLTTAMMALKALRV